MINITATFFRRLPEDDTPVPKHVGVDTYHELCLLICLSLQFVKSICWSVYWIWKEYLRGEIDLWYVRSRNIVEELLSFHSCNLTDITSPNCNLETSLLWIHQAIYVCAPQFGSSCRRRNITGHNTHGVSQKTNHLYKHKFLQLDTRKLETRELVM
jgi:hypothetical protein